MVRREWGNGAADQSKAEVSQDRVQRHRRMLEKIPIALAAGLFAAEERKEHGAARARTLGEGLRQLQDGHAAGSIVVGAIVDAVAGAIQGLADAKMGKAGEEQDDL